ncbi:MAG: hypothetical protein WCR24_04770 [Candidatus Methanomethylophilaceae archaeon]
MSDALSTAKSGLTSSSSSVSGISSGLKTLDIIGEDTVAKLSKAVGAMQLFTGALSMIALANTRMEAQNTKAAAEAAALTASVSVTGIGLTNVAIAASAAAVASVAMYSIVSTIKIKADTNNSADRGRISAMVGGILNG